MRGVGAVNSLRVDWRIEIPNFPTHQFSARVPSNHNFQMPCGAWADVMCGKLEDCQNTHIVRKLKIFNFQSSIFNFVPLPQPFTPAIQQGTDRVSCRWPIFQDSGRPSEKGAAGGSLSNRPLKEGFPHHEVSRSRRTPAPRSSFQIRGPRSPSFPNWRDHSSKARYPCHG